MRGTIKPSWKTILDMGPDKQAHVRYTFTIDESTQIYLDDEKNNDLKNQTNIVCNHSMGNH